MKTMLLTSLILAASPLAHAEEADSFSRGLQQAKRVAAMENQSDLPSRAYWLSRRCIKNSKKKISFQNGVDSSSESTTKQN